MLRKHILHLNQKDFDKSPLFFAWNCITLSINNKWDVNLIFNSENSLKMFLKLLIFRMQTVDGRKGTGIKLRNLKVANEIKSC